jgi:hypothetical protein
MKKTVLVIIAFLGCFCIINAQEVVSSAGDSYTAGGYEVSWTLGEPVIETVKSTDNNITLTQGFHQTDITVVAIDDLALQGLDLSVYPNPVNSILNLKATGREDVKLKYSLFGVDGRLLFQREIVNNPEEINMLPYAGGNYLLKVSTAGNDPVRTFKIVKR